MTYAPPFWATVSVTTDEMIDRSEDGDTSEATRKRLLQEARDAGYDEVRLALVSHVTLTEALND